MYVCDKMALWNWLPGVMMEPFWSLEQGENHFAFAIFIFCTLTLYWWRLVVRLLDLDGYALFFGLFVVREFFILSTSTELKFSFPR
jgi:hypothetical protein